MIRAFVISIVMTLIVLIAFNKGVMTPKVEIIKNTEDITNIDIPVFNTEYSPQNGLSYSGIYEGILPCADCRGTKVTIELIDNQFNRTVIRLGAANETPLVHTGKYIWDDSGTKIQLELPSKSKYQFIDGNLHQLGMSGAECVSFQGQPFVLSKIEQ